MSKYLTIMEAAFKPEPVPSVNRQALKVGGLLLVMLLGLSGFQVSRVNAEENDVALALRVARQYDLTPWQTKALLCVRVIENGKPGREYGVLHPKALNRHEDGTQYIQAQWAAGTIKKRLPNPSAIESFANRWAPIGADNDPNGLNNHWLGNFKGCLAQL